MKTQILLLAAAALLAAGCVSAPRYDDPDTQAASALAHRLLGKTADKIEFRLSEADADVFRLSSRGSRIVIEGNNANSMAVGLNHYLKYYCLVNVGWFSWDRIDVPKKLPKVAEPVEVKARVEDRFFLNYCTYGYTMPWWQWSEWEHFIDWMALQGINLPLAITGQEAIWYKIWTELGLTDEEVRTYFTGPAHLPWHRMLNIDHWGSPLPMSWLDGQAELQKKIVARERELNMRPVLPAFAGHVPPELNRIYPEAQIERMSDWAGFDLEDYPYFLDPMDPLFPVIQKKFVEKETEIYGTDHIYGIDLFNEMIPKSWEPDYLSRVSRQCYESLAAVDPDAVWLQMTWLFWNERKYWTQDRIEPYITSYPAEKRQHVPGRQLRGHRQAHRRHLRGGRPEFQGPRIHPGRLRLQPVHVPVHLREGLGHPAASGPRRLWTGAGRQPAGPRQRARPGSLENPPGRDLRGPFRPRALPHHEPAAFVRTLFLLSLQRPFHL